MVEFLHVRRWGKINGTNCYWVMLPMRIGSIETLLSQNVVHRDLI